MLAAGASTRLGQSKQLVKFGNESLLHRTVRLAIEASCSPVVVVLGFEAKQLQKEIVDLNAKIAINSEWQSGMGSSLRCSIGAIEQEDSLPERVLVLLSDQPQLSLTVIQALLRKSDEEDSLITASRYAGKLGAPAIFSKDLYPALKNIDGDKGAHQIIEKHRGDTSFIDFPGGEIDIDTPSDLKSVRSFIE
ncbi:MAG TPA: nucleotidyltransferase family protein [Pseudacidobacterium sp.]|nr:nucleotidyltransferase family protein [Pseudacidobacterium sp.]